MPVPPRASPSRLLVAAGAIAATLPVASLLNRFAAVPLREASAALGAGMLRAGGIAAVRTGTLLETGRGRFDVLVACSGGKFLAATLGLGAALAVLGSGSRARRFALALVAVPLAIAGNAGRVAGLVLLGPPVDPVAHTALGVWCFALVALALTALAGPVQVSAESAAPSAAPAATTEAR